jgi:hypothetical protein
MIRLDSSDDNLIRKTALNALERASEPNGLISRHSVEGRAALTGTRITEPVRTTATEAPARVIESSGWGGQELRDLWDHRDLFYFLA